jgi:hypothetical protein
VSFDSVSAAPTAVARPFTGPSPHFSPLPLQLRQSAEEVGELALPSLGTVGDNSFDASDFFANDFELVGQVPLARHTRRNAMRVAKTRVEPEWRAR